jgi:two-component system, OmpR family, response regulator
MRLEMVAGKSYDQPPMSMAATILFAREDLSIPGAAEDTTAASDPPSAVQARFFDLVNGAKPDIIVLDLSRRPAEGAETILTVRGRTDIPILVICNPEPALLDDYRVAGAAGCVAGPIDIIGLHRAIQNVLRVRGHASRSASRAPQNFAFAGMRFCPGRNLLASENGAGVDLTSSEARLLAHFLSKPWIVCTRSEIGELLYGPEHSVGDRAIDVVVNRLRKKLVSARGAQAEQLIKTEFRRGYSLLAEVAILPQEQSDWRHAL